jgi:hypothetical protein
MFPLSSLHGPVNIDRVVFGAKLATPTRRTDSNSACRFDMSSLLRDLLLSADVSCSFSVDFSSALSLLPYRRLELHRCCLG